MLGQRRRQHQPGISDHVLVIEGHIEAVETVQRSHREGALLDRDDVGVVTVIFPVQRALFAGTRSSTHNRVGGSGLRRRSTRQKQRLRT